MKVLATYSIKGGVGKTTSAVNLAYEAARTGARVLVWDLDPQGAATFFLRVKPRMKGGATRLVGSDGALDAHIRGTDFESINVVGADFSLRNLDVHLDDVKRPAKRLAELLAPLHDSYDVAFLDCPPSISLASESVFGAADALLVPTIPTPLSVRTLVQLDDFLADWPRRPDVMPYISMIDRRRKLQREVAAELRERWPALLAAELPNASVVERMGTTRAPVSVFADGSPASIAFAHLWSDIADRLWP